MFDIHHAKLELHKENEIIHKVINLDAGLDGFILIDSEDKKIATIAFNSILDALLGQIGKEDTYKEFSAALENINQIFKTWQNEWEKIKWLNVFIGILNKKSLIFSTLGKPSGYLIKRDGEIIEIIDKSDLGKKEFSFISSWDINEGEIVILGSNLILDELSKSDMRESALMEGSQNILKNIETILSGENIEKNIWFFAIKNEYFIAPKEETQLTNYVKTAKHLWMKCLDNKPVKKIVALTMIWKERLQVQWQLIKSFALLAGIFVSFFLLYTIISSVMWSTATSKDVETSKQNLIQAREYIKLANENLANPDIFDLNMKKAEELVYDIKDKQLFLNDIAKIVDDIAIIKKQFNGVESFDETIDKLISKAPTTSPIRVVEFRGKPYIITKTSVIGPIIPEQEPKETVFTQLSSSEVFKDAVVAGDNISILTSLSKVVNYTKSGFFQYADSVGQKTWQESKQLESFWPNIYLINKEANQVYKHKKTWENFDSGTPYFKTEDTKTLSKILTIGIDGWVYVLKSDLSLYKVFWSPKYRVESILLNKLPKNYNLEGSPENVKIKTRADLSYVYFLLNDKIWVFQPNTKLFQDTKSLTYIGQIEGKAAKILDFNVNHDGDILNLTDKWLYRMKFEISNGRIILR